MSQIQKEGAFRPNVKRDLDINVVSHDLAPTDGCLAACEHYCNRDTVAFYPAVGECMYKLKEEKIGDDKSMGEL